MRVGTWIAPSLLWGVSGLRLKQTLRPVRVASSRSEEQERSMKRHSNLHRLPKRLLSEDAKPGP